MVIIRGLEIAMAIGSTSMTTEEIAAREPHQMVDLKTVAGKSTTSYQKPEVAVIMNLT